MPQMHIESWTHPLSGQKMRRHLLGSCLTGRLLIKPSIKIRASDLLWIGDEIDSALDWLLRETMAHEPIATKRPNIYWLARLPLQPSSYLIEDVEGGGCELFELTSVWLRRPGSDRRW